MPKNPIDYSKCCIYKIEHIEDENLLYVGFTTNFNKRKCQHKISCYDENSKHYIHNVYRMIRDNGGWEMFRMIEVEKYPCKDKREAEKRETEVMKKLKSTMNTMRSFVCKEELKEQRKKYLEDNKEHIKEQRKIYRELKKEEIKEQRKEHYQMNKEELKKKTRKWYEENYLKNKEMLNEKQRQYYQKNREKILQRQKEYSDRKKIIE